LAPECENHGLGGDSRDNPYTLPLRFAPKPRLPRIAAIAAKHFPQLAQLAAPQQQQLTLTEQPMTEPTAQRFLVEYSQKEGLKTIKAVSRNCIVVEPDDFPEFILRDNGKQITAEQRRRMIQFTCISLMSEVSRIEHATDAGKIQSSLGSMHISDLLSLEKSMWCEIGARGAYQPERIRVV